MGRGRRRGRDKRRKGRRTVRPYLQARDLAVHGDALPGREAEVAARAVALAEPALHAHVHDGIRHGLDLEIAAQVEIESKV